MRAIIIVVLAGAIAACGTDASWQNLRMIVSERFSDAPELLITRQEINATPYAMISARFGRDAPAILILAADGPRGQQWMAANNISVVTRDGRLIRTVGLDIDMRDTFVGDDRDPLSNDPQLLAEIVRYDRFILSGDMPPQQVILKCKMTPKGAEVITIIEIDFQVIRLEEKCKSKGWDFKSTYWVDPFDGFVWQSVEHFADGMQPLEMSVLKPAS